MIDENPFSRRALSKGMDIRVTFPGGKRVDAQVGKHLVRTDQPQDFGGDDTAPAPFDLFLASLATCAGIYVLGFCQARKLPTEGIDLVQHVEHDAAGHVTRIDLELTLPDSFPEKYRTAVANAAANCKVKKLIAAPPEIAVRTTLSSAAPAVAALA